MRFTLGFITGLLLITFGMIGAPGQIGMASLDLADVFAKKLLREPLWINRYDPCPDVIDLEIRP